MMLRSVFRLLIGAKMKTSNVKYFSNPWEENLTLGELPIFFCQFDFNAWENMAYWRKGEFCTQWERAAPRSRTSQQFSHIYSSSKWWHQTRVSTSTEINKDKHGELLLFKGSFFIILLSFIHDWKLQVFPRMPNFYLEKQKRKIFEEVSSSRILPFILLQVISFSVRRFLSNREPRKSH